ncbi:FAD-dependent oxidoreductase [Nonomuraea sp. B12E4]|uniref:NAD(P)/FAD-dependent oxidoreductase n=1 Tax=Nonomuraea sp. B12E4 TaxID=3153564 RepID=UPI00325F860E
MTGNSLAKTPQTVDVAVVGAGIIGASCAFHLARRGVRVAVLESYEGPAMGSSGRSFAGVRAQWTDPVNIRLSWAGIQTYRDFATLHGVDAGYRPLGYLLLVPEDRWAAQLAAVELQRSLGVAVEVLSPEEAQRHASFVPDGIGGCTWGPGDGVVDPHLVTATYLAMARDLGASVSYRREVVSVDRRDGRWELATAQGRVRARQVVNAAGGWAGELAALAGLRVPVRHVRRMVFAGAQGAVERPSPMTIDVASGFFLRGEGARLLLGRANPAEAPGYTTRIDWDWLEHVLASGVRRFPWLAEVPIDPTASWAGTYEITPDHLPFLGAMPGAPGWINACGFSGHGVMQAPAVGRLIAEEAVDGRAHSIDIDALRIERLAETGTRGGTLVF